MLPAALLTDYYALLMERIDGLRAGLTGQDRAAVTTLVHQIGGSGAAYGFPALTEHGRRLERALLEARATNDEVEAYAALCEATALEGRASLQRC